ncbi:LytR/AlgR family response regulator transcription factor [Roseivirga echinicomitans]|uniref:Two-component system response regulator n=1 Tax=Roseivirga echinicomitans TaxID=296218 RepID=A0A150XND6_9BACT|nr:LytTR family DNA-binding domain-containing protein [Roseivirga echinicomitans]KYG80268.1 hypothetical protein AWN68_17370 [Roseivirga echinicomitans]
MKFNCIVVDDEPLAREGIKDYIDRVGWLDWQGEFKNASEAEVFLKDQAVDLMFIDINMPKVSGLELVESLKPKPLIIFITAYREFASESYELDAVDYLVKPVSFERFYKAVDKAYKQLQNLNNASEEAFYVKVDRVITKVLMEDVLYIEGMKDYIKIHLKDQSSLVTLISLKQIENLLPSHLFVRVQRSFIIAKNKVNAIDGNLIKIGETRITIAPNLRSKVLSKILGNKFWKRG